MTAGTVASSSRTMTALAVSSARSDPARPIAMPVSAVARAGASLTHNGSVVAAYLEHRDLAEAENEAERFFMNVVLCRVLYTHALVAAPRMSLGWLRSLAPFLGDPRLGMAGVFLQLSRVIPDEYPLRDSVRFLLRNELGFGRLVDFGVIAPRLQQLYRWSAHELAAPGLLDCVRDGALTYAFSFADREVWQPPKSFILRMTQRALPPERGASASGDRPLTP